MFSTKHCSEEDNKKISHRAFKREVIGQLYGIACLRGTYHARFMFHFAVAESKNIFTGRFSRLWNMVVYNYGTIKQFQTTVTTNIPRVVVCWSKFAQSTNDFLHAFSSISFLCDQISLKPFYMKRMTSASKLCNKNIGHRAWLQKNGAPGKQRLI